MKDVRVNGQITDPEVRVIGADGEMLGILGTDEAMRFARERGLDLVEVNRDANPPVCRITRHYTDAPQDAALGAKRALATHEERHGRIRNIEDRIVDAILIDMTGRRGLRHEWQRIDEDVKAEIRSTWAEIVRQAMCMCPHCGRDRLGTPRCGVCDNDE